MQIGGKQGFWLHLPEPSPEQHDEVVAFGRILLEAFALYYARNSERKGVWRRSGVTGQAQNVFGKGERALFESLAGELPNEDNFLDAIVYSVFGLILLREGKSKEETLRGAWPWPQNG